jgi:hypothetical protein
MSRPRLHKPPRTPHPNSSARKIQPQHKQMGKQQNSSQDHKRDCVARTSVPGYHSVRDAKRSEVLGAVKDDQDGICTCLVYIQEVSEDDAVRADESEQIYKILTVSKESSSISSLHHGSEGLTAKRANLRGDPGTLLLCAAAE